MSRAEGDRGQAPASSPPEAAREAAARAWAPMLVRERHFEDNVLFDDKAGSLRASGTVLRLRRTTPRRRR